VGLCSDCNRTGGGSRTPRFAATARSATAFDGRDARGTVVGQRRRRLVRRGDWNWYVLDHAN
jgi:hypothetical protein